MYTPTGDAKIKKRITSANTTQIANSTFSRVVRFFLDFDFPIISPFNFSSDLRRWYWVTTTAQKTTSDTKKALGTQPRASQLIKKVNLGRA